MEEELLNDPLLFKTPIVRNGAKATVGYKPEIWKGGSKKIHLMSTTHRFYYGTGEPIPG